MTICNTGAGLTALRGASSKMAQPGPGNERTPAPRRASPLLPGGWIAITVISILVVAVVWYEPKREISYTDFTKLVDSGQIKTLTLIGVDRANGEIREANSKLAQDLKITSGKFRVILPFTNDQTPLLNDIEKKDKAYLEAYAKSHPNDPAPEAVTISKQDDPSWIGPVIINMVLVIGLIAAIIFFLPRLRDPMGGGFLNSYIRSPAKRYEKGKGRITFEDVAGMETAKRELQEIVD